MPAITNFHDEHFFLSNFFNVEVVYDGEVYPTVEHAFQAAKTFDPEQRKTIQAADTPAQAKRLGRRVTLRPDWEQVKFDIMEGLLKQKFRQLELQSKLLETGEAELIEGNTWGDRVWGCVLVKGHWVGQNHLGQLLMKVRHAIREEQAALSRAKVSPGQSESLPS
jgi:ribA/ribD-fused uncharacterized protein